LRVFHVNIGVIAIWFNCLYYFILFLSKLHVIFLIEFSSLMHEFGCLAHFNKFVNLSTYSMQNHMNIGNQVQVSSKCIFKLSENFHHL
jgi:hypothetical protein